MLEIIRPRPAVYPRVVIFDFDGTLSLVRTGWQHVLRDVMLGALLPLAGDEPPGQVARRAADAIDRLTGHSIITQMNWLCAEVERSGGQPEAPEQYKRAYLARLYAQIDQRLDGIKRERMGADALLVPGARALLEELRRRDVPLVLLSGTDRHDVVREAEALDIARYFGSQIYGPTPETPDFTKGAVIRRLVAERGLVGPQLVSLGDGPVETEETRAVDGLAIGVAFDEHVGAGLDPVKRARLIEHGADAIVADFDTHAQLLAHVFPGAAAHRPSTASPGAFV